MIRQVLTFKFRRMVTDRFGNVPATGLTPLFFTLVFGLVMAIHLPTYMECEFEPHQSRAALTLWIYSSIALALGNVGALTYVIHIIRANWPEIPRIVRYCFATILAGALCLVALICQSSYPEGGILLKLLSETLRIGGMMKLLLLHDSAAVIVVTLLATAAVSVAWNIQELEGKALGLAVRRIQILSFAATGLLALTVFEFNRLTVWATSAIKEEASLAGAFSIGTGLVFTLFLVLILGPPSLQGAARVQALMAIASGQEAFNKDLWLLRNELPSSPLQHLAAIGSFLLPLASGLLSSLV